MKPTFSEIWSSLESRKGGLYGVILLGALALFSIWVGRFALDPRQCMNLVVYNGYWIMAVTFGLFVYFFYRFARTVAWKNVLGRRERWWVLLLILSGSTFLQVHEPEEFKVLVDEPVLYGTSMQMHLERKVSTPVRAFEVAGIYMVLNDVLDKRPYFFSFLVSILHDITGLRLENIFLLNTALTVLLLTLTYALARKLSNPFGGAVGVLCMASIPHLARTVNGAGFETLNLVMIVGAILLSIIYLERRDRDSLSLLCLTAVLLAQCRYESVIFVITIGLVILYGWWLERKPVFSAGLFLSPILLVPYLWRHMVFSVDDWAWQLADRPEAGGSPFALHMIPDNLHSAMIYFSNTGKSGLSSPWTVAIGVAALVVVIAYIARSWKSYRAMPPVMATVAFWFLSFLGFWLLMMAYAFGQFHDLLVSRLALPMYIPMMMAIVWAFWGITANRTLRTVVLIALSMIFVLRTMPVVAGHEASKTYHPATELEVMREVIEDFGDERFIVLTRFPMQWIALEQEVSPFRVANTRKKPMKRFLSYANSPKVLAFQMIRFDPNTNTARPANISNYGDSTVLLDPDFVTKPLKDYWITPVTGFRVSEVIDVEGVELDPKAYSNSREFLNDVSANLP